MIQKCLKAVFYKTVFVKFKISNYFKQNIDETHSKQPKFIPTYGFLKSQEKNREPKVSRLLPNVCDFQKENYTQGYGFKNL
jgi:hypothetical protein